MNTSHCYFQSIELRHAWQNMVGRVFCDTFATLTFRDPLRDHDRIAKHVEELVAIWHLRAATRIGLASISLNPKPRAKLFGKPHELYVGPYPSAVRRGRLPYAYAAVIEPHLSGDPHVHVLIAKSPMLPTLPLEIGRRLWTRELGGRGRGTAKIERPISQEAVRKYITKLVPERAEVCLSWGFGGTRRGR